jgi:exonuclease III
MGFGPVTERICSIKIKGTFHNTTIINIYVPTEDDSAEENEMFYEELQKQIDKISKYNMIIVIGDVNAKIGREQIYIPIIGKFSQHDTTSPNGEKLCSFAEGNNMVIASTYFKHKQIHQGTWKIPGKEQKNQTDHVLVNNRRKSAIQDVRVFRGANCDSDHYLVVVKV